MTLSLHQRFALARARYEISRISRPTLEKLTLRILRGKFEMKNGIQETLQTNGILFRIDEVAENGFLPDIISEETFCHLLQLTEEEDTMPRSIDDTGFEDDDLEDDNMMSF